MICIVCGVTLWTFSRENKNILINFCIFNQGESVYISITSVFQKKSRIACRSFTLHSYWTNEQNRFNALFRHWLQWCHQSAIFIIWGQLQQFGQCIKLSANGGDGMIM